MMTTRKKKGKGIRRQGEKKKMWARENGKIGGKETIAKCAAPIQKPTHGKHGHTKVG